MARWLFISFALVFGVACAGATPAASSPSPAPEAGAAGRVETGGPIGVIVLNEDAELADPERCEDRLARYAAVEGVRSEDYSERAALLQAALDACERIAPREVGSFERLAALLVRPIPRYTAQRSRYGVSHLFAAPPAGFTDALEAEPSITARIARVHALVHDAVAPLRAVELYEDEISDVARIEATLAPLLQSPFVPEPMRPTHAVSWHEVLAPRLLSERMPPVPSYRRYLMEQAGERHYDCWVDSSAISSSTILRYLVKDGVLDEEEWRVAQDLLAQATSKRQWCWKPVFEGSPRAERRRARIDWGLQRIKGDGPSLSQHKNAWDAFEELLVGLEAARHGADMYRVFLEEYERIEHRPRELEALSERVATVLTDIDRRDRSRARKQCLRLSREMDALLRLGVAERRFESWLCHCLGPKVELDPRSRGIIDRKLRSLSDYNCRFTPGGGA